MGKQEPLNVKFGQIYSFLPHMDNVMQHENKKHGRIHHVSTLLCEIWP